jgi:ribosomal protein L40E
MNKFIGKKETKTTKKSTKKVAPLEIKPVVEVITKGEKEFVICPKCGWKHTRDTKKCRFCGAKIGE